MKMTNKLMPEVPTDSYIAKLAKLWGYTFEEASSTYDLMYESAQSVACEPVAYRHFHGEENEGWEYYDAPTGDDCEGCEPLYTTPQDQSAKIAELEAKLKVAEGALEAIAMTDKPSPYSFGFINQQTQARNALNKIRGE
jgi:hypothetical protein